MNTLSKDHPSPNLTSDQSENPSLQEFARYEFKYLLDGPKRTSLEQEVGELMVFDGHVHPDLDNCYLVRSLYFDNPAAANYYEKIDGVKRRRKFRIRTYGDSPEPGLPIFLEEKGRFNERTYKKRIAISADHLDLFLDPKGFDDLLALYPDQPLISSFVFDSIRRNLAPKVLVDYWRRPYMSVFDWNFRLTFDTNLRAVETGTLFPNDSAVSWRRCRAGWTILEVKFDRRIPAWFHRTLQSYEMRRLSVSKFCLGMETCELAINLE